MHSDTLNLALAIAIDAARAGGEITKNYFHTSLLNVELKNDESIVTEADKRSEEVIVEIIKEAFPDHGILGEEGADYQLSSPYRWHIDPLDGTANFATGVMPEFVVSIALAHEDEIIVAVVYQPLLDQLFFAVAGQGAFFNQGASSNNEPMRVSEEDKERVVVCVARGRVSEDLRYFQELLTPLARRFRHFRILGATALEMAYVASGTFAGFIGLGGHTWDYAAGALLIQEAGGVITSLKGDLWDINESRFVASNGVIHDRLLEEIERLS